MNNKTYDKIIDSTIEGFVIFLWHGLMYAICLLTVTIIVFSILPSIVSSHIIDIYEINYMLFVASPTTIISLPLTILIFYIRKAQKDYDIKKWRNFWMCFSTVICIDRAYRHQNSTEIDEWIVENANSLTTKTNDCYHFLSSADAMAFKLRWIE